MILMDAASEAEAEASSLRMPPPVSVSAETGCAATATPPVEARVASTTPRVRAMRYATMSYQTGDMSVRSPLALEKLSPMIPIRTSGYVQA